jgi:hypothetical protein
MRPMRTDARLGFHLPSDTNPDPNSRKPTSANWSVLIRAESPSIDADNIAAEVLTVRVAGVPGAIDAWLNEHCGGNCGVGETEQLSETDPPKPFCGSIVTVDVAFCPGLIVSGVKAEDDIEKSAGAGAGAMLAVTVRSEFRVTTQFPVPEQPPPLQPAKMLPESGTKESVMLLPLWKPATQLRLTSIPVPRFVMQLMPAGALVMVPEPVPEELTVSSWKPAGTTKFAVRVMSEFIVI